MAMLKEGGASVLTSIIKNNKRIRSPKINIQENTPNKRITQFLSLSEGSSKTSNSTDGPQIGNE